MLHEFLVVHRDELIRRCREKVARRLAPDEVPGDIVHGVPLFLSQLVDTLRCEQFVAAAGANYEPAPAGAAIALRAALHGTELLRRGYGIDQVVHDYGDVCQTVMELAIEQKAGITVNEFRILNRCLDCAIADAVSAFGSRDAKAAADAAEASRKLLDSQAGEMLRLIELAIKAFSAIKTGNVGLNGATGAALGNVLSELRRTTLAGRPPDRADY